MENAYRPAEELVVFKALRPEIGFGLGVVDIKRTEVESANAIARAIEHSDKVLGEGRVSTSIRTAASGCSSAASPTARSARWRRAGTFTKGGISRVLVASTVAALRVRGLTSLVPTIADPPSDRIGIVAESIIGESDIGVRLEASREPRYRSWKPRRRSAPLQPERAWSSLGITRQRSGAMTMLVKTDTPNGPVYVNMDNVKTLRARKGMPGGTIFLFDKDHSVSVLTDIEDVLKEVTRQRT